MPVDVTNGPVWIIYVVAAIFAVLMLSGRGAFLIAGYNTASKKQKRRFDERKLCRVTGAGMCVIVLLFVVTGMLYCIFFAEFDQLMLGYQKKESSYLPAEYLRGIFDLAGMVMPAVLLHGRVAGRWKKLTIVFSKDLDRKDKKCSAYKLRWDDCISKQAAGVCTCKGWRNDINE